MTRLISREWTPALRALLAGLAALALADCAGTARPEAGYRPAPASHFVVYVRPGDTVSEIAERYRVSEEDIVAINNLPNRHAIFTGDQLYVPAYGVGRPPVDTAPIRQAGPQAAPTNRDIQRATLPQPVAQANGRAVVIPRPAPRASVAGATLPRPVPRSASAPAPAPAANARFAWPLNGRVLSNFGPGPTGERNDGINIAVASGTPFHAAAAGNVTYVGNELRGFGNLLLIRHDNGYVTAYAHAERITVARGARVAAGDIVGYSGATGDVAQPQLHFEIRDGTRPVNPVALMGPANTNQANAGRIVVATN